jgi:hypothetical protein
VCLNVPIARTGEYEYLPSEIGLQGDGIVKVYRNEDEVFSPQAMASFEGKPVTNDHPPDLLTPQNATVFSRGSAKNVRRSPTDKDLLVADLVIYDESLIDLVKNKGKREVSCGYEFNLVDNGDGTYSQTNIVGNHVAVVDNGRAGHTVAIKDSKNSNVEGEKKRMNKMKMPTRFNGPFSKILIGAGLKKYAEDAEPHELAEAVDALNEEREPMEEAKDAEVETAEQQSQENNAMAEMKQEIAQLKEMIMQMAKGAQDEKPEDAIDGLISELSEGETSTGDEEESMTLPVEEMDEDIPDGVVVAPEDRPENPIPGADSAAMIRALKAMKKVVAKIPDAKTRKVACDSLISEFRKAKKTSNKVNQYAQILQAQRNNAVKQQSATDSATDRAAKLEAAHKAKNPHYKEVK